MKSIRRSLKSDKDSKIPPQLSITPKNITAFPPKKVIKALYDYEPQNNNNQELAFHKGDFFHVLSREDDAEWYEACNPLIPSARGLVPVAFFEVIGKQQRQSDNSIASPGENSEGNESGFSETGDPTLQHKRSESTTTAKPAHNRGLSMIGKNAGNMVYGIVQYDFNAERADELDAKAGEAIIVVAQSNPEWFVAKPIGRLGGPGLIPVSFVDIKDTTTMRSVTNPLDAVRKAGVPRVEEWKKFAAEYKNSSISLGKFDSPQAQMSADMARMSLQNSGQQQQQHPSTNSYGPPHPSQMHHSQETLVAPISATVPRYCFDNDMYWFVIECQMEDGRWFELSRYYADFYDFQIALLETFPEEAGNRGKPRTLPYMPGPVAHVTDAISNGRRQNLDEYIKKIISMPPHISKSLLVRNLFKPKRGQDFEIDPNALGEDYRLSGASQQSLQQIQSNQSSLPMVGTPNSGSGYGSIPPGSRNSQQRGQPNTSAGTSYPGPNGSSHLLQSQASNLTQGSNSSSIKAPNPPGGHLKIKIFFQQEIVAIRVPQDITFQSLKEKIAERLKIDEDIVIQYKDEPSNNYMTMENDQQLDVAVQRNPKLALNVSYATG